MKNEKEYYYSPELLFGIPNHSLNMGEAERFIEYAMSEEAQDQIAALGEGFPVNENSFDKILNYYENEGCIFSINNREGECIEVSSEDMVHADYVKIKAEVEQYVTLLSPYDRTRNRVLENAAQYINGDTSLADAVDNCMDKREESLN